MIYQWIRFRVMTPKHGTDWQIVNIIENTGNYCTFKTIGDVNLYVKMNEELEFGDFIERTNRQYG